MKFWMTAAAMLIGASVFGLPEAGLAQGAKNSCPGGISACIQRCIKGGGQPRLCPRYCEKQKGC
jgi:hypothetical protein